MLITERQELLDLEYALCQQAQRHRDYAKTQPPVRANQFKYQAERLEAMRMRLLQEHFPDSYESERLRLKQTS